MLGIKATGFRGGHRYPAGVTRREQVAGQPTTVTGAANQPNSQPHP